MFIHTVLVAIDTLLIAIDTVLVAIHTGLLVIDTGLVAIDTVLVEAKVFTVCWSGHNTLKPFDWCDDILRESFGRVGRYPCK